MRLPLATRAMAGRGKAFDVSPSQHCSGSDGDNPAIHQGSNQALETIKGGGAAFFWPSAFLVVIVMLMSACLMQSLAIFILDGTASLDARMVIGISEL